VPRAILALAQSLASLFVVSLKYPRHDAVDLNRHFLLPEHDLLQRR
jgi:hypothetical protein